MMRGSRRLAVCAALVGLLAAGTSMTAARAVTNQVTTDAGSCSNSGKNASCTVTATIPAPVLITVGAGADSAQNVTVTWTAACFMGAEFATTTGTSTKPEPYIFNLTLPSTNPNSCSVTVIATLANSGDLNVVVEYQPAASSTPTPTPTPTPTAGAAHLVVGYAGKCLDDAGNSSANRAKVQIWTCNSSDQAQSWKYTGGELIHNGKCANDRRSGGSGSRVILYTCNHAPDETWTHRSDGEFVLSAKGGVLCLDDPAYSTRNGTQLIVYTCKNSSNQHWSLP
jgi:hypothetical protein